MHVLRLQQEVGERQREQRFDPVDIRGSDGRLRRQRDGNAAHRDRLPELAGAAMPTSNTCVDRTDDGAPTRNGGASTVRWKRRRANGEALAGKDANGMNGLSHAVKLWRAEIYSVTSRTADRLRSARRAGFALLRHALPQVRAVRSAKPRCAAVHRVQRRHAARRNRLSALRAAGGGRTKHAARASDSRRRIRRRSPPGVTLFRRIACCRHSSTARNWRFRHICPRTRRRRRGAASAAAGPHCRGAAGDGTAATSWFQLRAGDRARRFVADGRAAARRTSPHPRFATAGGTARVARAQNVRGAFACAATLHGATVAIVDDVMTTGATLAAAAVALHDAGAGRVDAWIVARTPPPSHAPAKSP